MFSSILVAYRDRISSCIDLIPKTVPPASKP